MTQNVLEVTTTALMVSTGGNWCGVGPEGLTAIQILLVFLQNLKKKVTLDIVEMNGVD